MAKFHFHEFFTQFIFDNCLVKSKLSTAKKSKTTTFSRVFHQEEIDNREKNFWTKNEDFEQCVLEKSGEFPVFVVGISMMKITAPF